MYFITHHTKNKKITENVILIELEEMESGTQRQYIFCNKTFYWLKASFRDVSG